ncbi:MAG: YbaN family protein [Actinomycetia bacterium]|nr:YbaN family protein [Actinomycetes bacterium]
MKYVALSSGTLFLSIGVVGIFLPILPTTPFLLLSAACYAKGSRKFYNWLLNHRILGKYIKDYREKRGIEARAKLVALILLWATILSSAIFATSIIWVRIILVLVAIGVTVHLLRLKTL